MKSFKTAVSLSSCYISLWISKVSQHPWKKTRDRHSLSALYTESVTLIFSKICQKVCYSFSSQQGNVISSTASATHALRYRKGGFPLLLLGPQTSSEASWVLMIARYYRKLMVRGDNERSLYISQTDVFHWVWLLTRCNGDKQIISEICFMN